MALMQGQTSIAAGATTNVLAGQQFEFVPYNCRVQFGFTQPAAGTLTATVFSGTDILQQSAAVPNTGAPPSIQDNFYLYDVAMKGDRLQLLVTNPSGAAIVITWAVILNPV